VAKKIASVLVLAAAVLVAAAVAVPGSKHPATSTGIERETDLAQVVAAFVRGIPREGEGRYSTPRPDEARRMAEVFSTLRAGQPGRAAQLAREVDYEVTKTSDVAGDVAVLREGGTQRRGWGLFVQRLDGSSRLVVEVPHPIADAKTELLGLEIFNATRADALLIAGAHRSAAPGAEADVAHQPDSAFAAVNRAAAQRGTVVLQPHGFDARAPGRRLGDAVVSSGTPEPGLLAVALARELRHLGVRTCLYRGDRCRELAARTNVEGIAARRAGAVFIHLELAKTLRSSAHRRARIVSAIDRALGAVDR
jgi:hypothetical protein